MTLTRSKTTNHCRLVPILYVSLNQHHNWGKTIGSWAFIGYREDFKFIFYLNIPVYDYWSLVFQQILS